MSTSNANNQLDQISRPEDLEDEEPKMPDHNIVETDQDLTLDSALSDDDLEEERVDTAASTMGLTTKVSLLARTRQTMSTMFSSLYSRVFKCRCGDPKQDESDLEENIIAKESDHLSTDQGIHALSRASSSTSISKGHIYDIFLSFRGVDTREKFTDHLNNTLKQKGFRTFRDDDDITRGKKIKSELREAIIKSRMSVVILSKNYANSKACLFELQTILEQCEKSDHMMFPVFYEVSPENIKEQAKNLSFRTKVEEATVKGWSEALNDVASRAGEVSRIGRYEVKFIEDIAVKLKSMLAGKYLRNGNHLKLEENGSDLAGRRLKPLTKDFIENTEAMNTQNVWKCLMNDNATKIGIYGMAGVGKTTIMKYIHNQLLEEKRRFDTVYWVTVSRPFSIKRLQMNIAKAMNISLSDGDTAMRASELFTDLNQRVSRGERYVLILDDIWEAFDLDSVGIPEPTTSNGCKLAITTRLLELCTRMYCRTVKVELLTEEEALRLFLCKAVGHEAVLSPEVKDIATKITAECARLPLAIVTVAGSMTGLKEPHDWRNALNELTNSTKDDRGGDGEVFKRLKFSYTRLRDKMLQDCFLYCALYPEDHDIPVKELIEYWIAEGLIADSDIVQAEFDNGQAILGKLNNASLLEKFTNESGEVCVRIHDLIRDMALRITKGSPRFMVKSGKLTKGSPQFMVKSGKFVESITYDDWSEDLERISLTYNFIKELPKDPPHCPQLTTLLLGVNELSLIPDLFFTRMLCLKVLDLSANKLKLLPNSISNLVNLLALILADSELLEDVPSLKKLKALKVFKLTNSLIKNLPEGLEKLVSLRKLDLSGNKKLKFTSGKLRWLSKLQSLIIDGTRVEVSAEDLLCLSQLKVVSVHLRNVAELTCYLTSQQFQRLEKYSLMVGRDVWPLSNGNEVLINVESKPFRSGVDQVVLPNNINFLVLQGFHVPVSLSAIPGLKDARDLHRCEVKGCDGLQFIFSSSFVSEESQIISLRTVESFYLSNLPSCRLLFDGIIPPSNISFNLKRLTFESCHSLKNIFPVELLQNFPNLEQLKVDRCDNVEDIITGEDMMSDSNTITLPRLQYLFLNFLPKLKSIYPGKMVCESVKLIHVTKCSMLSRLPLSWEMDNEQATAPPALKCITGEEEWWESLEWDHLPTKSALEPFLERGSRNEVTSLTINDMDSSMDSDADMDKDACMEASTGSYLDTDTDTSTESWTLIPDMR